MIKFVFSWDDGSAEDMRLAELMHKYDQHNVTFYIPSEWQSYNLAEGREPLKVRDVFILDDAFTIGSHTVSHPLLTRIKWDDALREICDSQAQLSALLGHEVESFCYPRGYANDEIRAIARAFYSSGRNTLVGHLTPGDDPLWQNTTVHAGGKRRKDYEGTTWLAEAYRLLDEAIERGRDEDLIYHTWGHSWELTREDGWHDLEELLKRIKELQ